MSRDSRSLSRFTDTLGRMLKHFLSIKFSFNSTQLCVIVCVNYFNVE